MYSVRNANLGTLKLELAEQPFREKRCIPAPPSTPQLTVTYQSREKKSRIVKNGIPPSSSDGPVMTVKPASTEKPLKDRERKGMQAHLPEQVRAT